MLLAKGRFYCRPGPLKPGGYCGAEIPFRGRFAMPMTPLGRGIGESSTYFEARPKG